MLASRLSVPRPRHRLVGRDRLSRQLSAGAEGPLTLVHGPAGSGKTFLVATWVADGLAPGPVAWVSLDSDVDAPGPFWAYVLRALEGCGLSLGEGIGLPARAEEIDRSFLARVAAVLSEQPGPVVVVLDEYDRVTSRAISTGLDFVLRNAAPNLRLIVIGRRPPGLRLARHRVAGELTEIGPAELAFTSAEAGELLALHGVPLPAQTVEDLTARTDGWVTGVRLSALALQRGSDPRTGRDLPVSGGDIAEFLLSEVVDELPDATQDMLLRTCLLERVDGEIADVLTGRTDGRRILTELAATGTFVRAVAGTTSWFRYHELFAEALRSRLRHAHPELVPDLHRRASQWLADDGQVTEAVAHAVAAGDWGLAAGHVVDHLAVGHLLVGLETHRLGTLFAGLPAGGTDPQVALVRAALAMARFDAGECLAALAVAEAHAGDVAASRRVALRLGIAALRIIVSRVTGDLAAAEAAGAQARELTARVSPESLARHPELPALLMSSLGTLQLWSGSPDAAEESLRAGLAAAVGPFTEQPRSNCLGQLAVVHYLHGRLRKASDCAVEAIGVVDRSGLSPTTRVPVGHLAAAAVAWEWSDLPAVRTHVEQAASSIGTRHDAPIAVMVALLRARYRLAQGDAVRAGRILDAAAGHRERLAPGSFLVSLLALDEAMIVHAAGNGGAAAAALDVLPADSPARRIGLARLRLAAGKPADALTALGGAADDPSLGPLLAVRAHLVAARAVHATGDVAGAVRQLERALRLGRPDGIRRPFVEAGPWVRAMLARDPLLASRHGWLGAAQPDRDRHPPGAEEAPALVVEPLTTRELEVLRLLAQPMTGREVAEALHLSMNTVKTHLRSIYRKLAAPGHTSAVRRARTLGIL